MFDYKICSALYFSAVFEILIIRLLETTKPCARQPKILLRFWLLIFSQKSLFWHVICTNPDKADELSNFGTILYQFTTLILQNLSCKAVSKCGKLRTYNRKLKQTPEYSNLVVRAVGQPHFLLLIRTLL